MIQSPLNYTGGKYKLLPQILPLFPSKIDGFVDLFCGGCNVGINVNATHYIYNDSCEPLIHLYKTMQNMSVETFVWKINKIIENYGLSDVKMHSYDYYNCNSAKGLSSYNKEPYLRLRKEFNELTECDEDYYIMLYVLIIYAFNNQIRFNSKGKFNLPVGKRDFNEKMYQKLVSFFSILHSQQAEFRHGDFRKFDMENLNANDFVYADPPYLITCASYNERGGWTEQDERDLLERLDSLTKRNIKFALSNVLETKGKKNTILMEWIESKPQYKMIDLNFSYNNANYQRQQNERKTREVLIRNY